MHKKLLTLEDLAMFCSQHNFASFNANETGYTLAVQVPSTYEEDKERLDDTTLFGKIKLLHTGRNRNGSCVTEESAKKAMSKIKYKPILANFCEIDGVRDFTSHDFEELPDGTTNYIERQVGCFTADEPTLEYDSETDRYYLYANVAIPREYTDAADIIERKNGTKVSAELSIYAMSYDAKEKMLVLDDFEVTGATLLGKNPETGENVEEGMQGARLDIADFSTAHNSVTFTNADEFIKIIQELKQSLDNYTTALNAEKSKEGGIVMNKLETLLAQYSVTLEELPFAAEIADKTDEELEVLFSEHFNTPEETVEVEEAEETTEVEAAEENAEEAEQEEITEVESTTTEELEAEETVEEAVEETVTETEAEEAPEETSEVEETTGSFSVTINKNSVNRTFEISLNDQINALYDLVNDTYANADNAWYSVQVYDNYVVMVDYWTGVAYRQSYSFNEESYLLTGDRVSVYAHWLTKDEEAQLESLKRNYNALVEQESQRKRDAVLSDEIFSVLAETEEWQSLMKEASKYSIEDLTLKANALYGKYCREKNQMKTNSIGKSHIKSKATPYGTLFSK